MNSSRNFVHPLCLKISYYFWRHFLSMCPVLSFYISDYDRPPMHDYELTQKLCLRSLLEDIILFLKVFFVHVSSLVIYDKWSWQASNAQLKDKNSMLTIDSCFWKFITFPTKFLCNSWIINGARWWGQTQKTISLVSKYTVFVEDTLDCVSQFMLDLIVL